MERRSLMQDIRRFSNAPGDVQRLLLQAAMLVLAARVTLSTLPFRWVRLLASGKPSISTRLAVVPTHQLSWAVRAAARHIPRATCLTQALAMQRLLAFAGRSADLQIGVAKDARSGFEAHAWVECEGDIVVGNNAKLRLYAPMLTIRTAEA